MVAAALLASLRCMLPKAVDFAQNHSELLRIAQKKLTTQNTHSDIQNRSELHPQRVFQCRAERNEKTTGR